VGTRLEAFWSGTIAEALRRSEKIQNELWTHAIHVGGKNPND
jgi:hypothetical protein